jgi:DNA invertase Pin-like site-specific DNA recombinase
LEVGVGESGIRVSARLPGFVFSPRNTGSFPGSISLRDNLDLSTPSGRLMMHIIGAMAQFERELIKERVSAGMHAARKRGSRIGRPRAYANADKIRDLRAQDVPWRAIAAQLCIGTGTAIRAVQNGGAA